MDCMWTWVQFTVGVLLFLALVLMVVGLLALTISMVTTCIDEWRLRPKFHKEQ